MYYEGKNLYIELMFGGTIPAEPEQDYEKGNNDLYAAAAARFAYELAALPLADGYSGDWVTRYVLHMQAELHAWGERSEFLNVHSLSMDAWESSFLSSIAGDAGLMGLAVALVTTYSLFVLGALSPVHFRSCTATVGTMCVVLGAASGYALAFFAGQQTSSFHNILPFMVIGVGVDDMFVIVSTID